MIAPKTYRGYNEDGEQIASATAEDANNYLNPDEVKAAVEQVKEAIKDGISSITKALNNLTTDAEEALIVQGTSMAGPIEEVCTGIKGLPDDIGESMDGIYTQSVKVHDDFQKELNSAAKKSVQSVSGVVKVRE